LIFVIFGCGLNFGSVTVMCGCNNRCSTCQHSYVSAALCVFDDQSDCDSKIRRELYQFCKKN